MVISRFSFGWVGAAMMALFNVAAWLNHPFGMDIGFELGLIFAGITYYFLRRIEISLASS